MTAWVELPLYINYKADSMQKEKCRRVAVFRTNNN